MLVSIKLQIWSQLLQEASCTAPPRLGPHCEVWRPSPVGRIQARLLLLCFALLHFTDVVFFKNWRFVATLQRASTIGAIFPTEFAHLMSLCHTLVILTTLQTFLLLLCLLWWSVVTDLWWYYCHCLGAPTKNFINNCCVCSDSFTDRPFSISLPLLGPPCSLRHNIEIRPIYNPSMASKWKERYTSLTSFFSAAQLARS